MVAMETLGSSQPSRSPWQQGSPQQPWGCTVLGGAQHDPPTQTRVLGVPSCPEQLLVVSPDSHFPIPRGSGLGLSNLAVWPRVIMTERGPGLAGGQGWLTPHSPPPWVRATCQHKAEP